MINSGGRIEPQKAVAGHKKMTDKIVTYQPFDAKLKFGTVSPQPSIFIAEPLNRLHRKSN
jgi:hypothetical protein